jgi:hypothetical protein
MQGRYMTPLEINMLLHYYTTPGQFPHHDSPAQIDAVHGFVNQGLIRINDENPRNGDHGFVVTERGMALIDAWLRTPLPVQRWEVPARPE